MSHLFLDDREKLRCKILRHHFLIRNGPIENSLQRSKGLAREILGENHEKGLVALDRGLREFKIGWRKGVGERLKVGILE